MRILKKSIGIVAFGIASGGLGFIYAAPIAGFIGSTGVLGITATTGFEIAVLSGAPLEFASLAALGGGALSVGGGGMAAGITVVATGSGITGTCSGVVLAVVI